MFARIGLLLLSVFQPVSFSVTDVVTHEVPAAVVLTAYGSTGGKQTVLWRMPVTTAVPVLVPRSSKLVAVTAPGYITHRLPFSALQPDNSIELKRAVIVRGTVRDAASQLPIQARGQVIGGGQQLEVRGFTSTAEGAFELPVAPGENTVVILAKGYSQFTQTITADREENFVDAELKPGVVLTGTFTAILGKVMNGGIVEARPSAPPTVMIVRASVRRNAFSLSDLSAGASYQLIYSSRTCPPVVLTTLTNLPAATQQIALAVPPCESR